MAKKQKAAPVIEEQSALDEIDVIARVRGSLVDLTEVYPDAQKRIENAVKYVNRIITWAQKADERAAKRAEWKVKQDAKKSERIVKLQARMEAAAKKLAQLQA